MFSEALVASKAAGFNHDSREAAVAGSDEE